MGSRSSQRNFWESSSRSRRLSHGLYSFTSPLTVRSCEMTERTPPPPPPTLSTYSSTAQPGAESVQTELLHYNLQQQQQPNSLHHQYPATSNNLSTTTHQLQTKFYAAGRSSFSKEYDSYSSYDSIDI